MFPYDPQLAQIAQTPTQTVADVLQTMQAIDGLCQDTDGLKWFNGLYMSVTAAIKLSVEQGAFRNPQWLSMLDVTFASLYFSALEAALTGGNPPGCWGVMFAKRNNARLRRIQFALAGMNAHINHDLCLAIVATCRASNTVPQHGTPQYRDYTAVNPILGGLVQQAETQLDVDLPGNAVPPVASLEQIIAAWDVAAAREGAWSNAQHFWNLPPILADGLMDTIDGTTSVISKALLITT